MPIQFPLGQFVDGSEDHIARKVLEPERVYELLAKYSVNPNAEVIQDEWIALDLGLKYNGTNDTYENCICGHDIENNLIARNIYNHNMIILGSECIRKCNIKITKKHCLTCIKPMFNSRKDYCDECDPAFICRLCGDRKQKRNPYCAECLIGCRSEMKFGKHKGRSWFEILMDHKDYCYWVLQTEFREDTYLHRFQSWLHNYDIE